MRELGWEAGTRKSPIGEANNEWWMDKIPMIDVSLYRRVNLKGIKGKENVACFKNLI